MANEVKTDNNIDEVNTLKEKVKELEHRLRDAEGKNDQLENAYKVQGERYNRLFNLFAYNIDYFIKQDN